MFSCGRLAAPLPHCGCRLITANQSAMLPQRPTLLVAQSCWLICMHVNTHTYTHRRREFTETFTTLIKMCLVTQSRLGLYLFVSSLPFLSLLLLLLLIFPLLLLLLSLFSQTEDIFILHGKDKKNPLIYGLFTTSRYVPVQLTKHLKFKACM